MRRSFKPGVYLMTKQTRQPSKRTTAGSSALCRCVGSLRLRPVPPSALHYTHHALQITRTHAASDDVFANERGWWSLRPHESEVPDKSVMQVGEADTPTADDDRSMAQSSVRSTNSPSEDVSWEWMVSSLWSTRCCCLEAIVRSFLADGRLHCETRGSVYAFTVLMPMAALSSRRGGARKAEGHYNGGAEP